MRAHAGRLGFRCSDALQRRVEAAGAVSAAARALLIIGLHAAGADVTAYRAEALAVLPEIADPSIAAALERALFNIGSTTVEQRFNTHEPAPQMARSTEGLGWSAEEDPFAGVGIEV